MVNGWFPPMAASLALVMTGAAAAEPLDSRARSVVFLEVIAQRGGECDLLAPWQVAALRLQMTQETDRLSPAQHEAALAAAAEKAAATPCDSPAITGWIDVAGPNMTTEALPPYLLVYRAMATRAPRPALLTERAGAVDIDTVLTAVEAQITDFAASGATFEGGKPWPHYAKRTGEQITAVLEQALAPATPDDDPMRRMMADAIDIVHLWSETRGAQ